MTVGGRITPCTLKAEGGWHCPLWVGSGRSNSHQQEVRFWADAECPVLALSSPLSISHKPR